MTEEIAPAAFENGIDDAHDRALYNTILATKSLIEDIEALPKSRSYSLAITKLEEAKHWLADRYGKPS